MGKPRLMVIVQDDSFDATDSITICAFTTDETDAPLFRLPVEPSERDGLRSPCRLMVDKVTTVPKSRIGPQIGARMTRTCCDSTRPSSSFLGLRFRREQAGRNERLRADSCTEGRLASDVYLDNHSYR